MNAEARGSAVLEAQQQALQSFMHELWDVIVEIDETDPAHAAMLCDLVHTAGTLLGMTFRAREALRHGRRPGGGVA